MNGLRVYFPKLKSKYIIVAVAGKSETRYQALAVKNICCRLWNKPKTAAQIGKLIDYRKLIPEVSTCTISSQSTKCNS